MAKDRNPNEESPRTTRRSVFVACKLPHGLVIRDYIKTVVNENVLGGGTRPVDVYRPVGPKVFIKGSLRKQTDVVGGYAITENVDAGIFEKWMEWNKDSAAVRNKMIFGHESRDRVEGMANDLSKIKSGLEPLDVTMVKSGDRLTIADARVHKSGAGNVIDGKVDAA